MATPKTRYPLRGLVTCAGISGVGPTVDFSIVGTFICAQAAARELVKRNVTGSMVLVASMSAHGSNKVCNAHCGSPKYLSQLTYTAL
jgi:NAD(P)-dependent dehydrogenase (short-subunit alcohol dehydrogenase family)